MPDSERVPIRHRTNWRGKLILQIGEQVPVNFDPATDIAPQGYTTRWRDAKVEDLGFGFHPVDECPQ